VKVNKKICLIILCATILLSVPSRNSETWISGGENTADFPHNAFKVEENTTLHFIMSSLCQLCLDAFDEVQEFLSNHPEITLRVYEMTNETEKEMAKDFLNSDELYWPTVIFERGLCKYLINGQSITSKTLEEVYSQIINNPSSCQEWTYYQEFKYWVAFVTGILSGLSPCIILITGVFGTSLIANQSRNYFLRSLIGFSLGVLLMYFIIGFSFTFFIDGAIKLFGGIAMKLILGIPLILLGLWQCIDAWNENSRLFKTPEKLKGFFRNLTENDSGLSAFLLGAAFTLLKSPCIAGILLSLIFSVNRSGSFGIGRVSYALGLFSIGVLIPILAVFGILRIGISNEKINIFRVKARPYLRLISGLVIIVTTIFAII
jgi:cytochrome c biogenesis protein CcdA